MCELACVHPILEIMGSVIQALFQILNIRHYHSYITKEKTEFILSRRNRREEETTKLKLLPRVLLYKRLELEIMMELMPKPPEWLITKLICRITEELRK